MRHLCSICLTVIAFGLACLAALPGETAPPVSDLLILRSSAIARGEFKSYSDNRCQLGERNFSRDQIAWIGFSTAMATPPAVTDPAHDEVHLRDGTVQTGRLVSVNLTQVVTEKKSYNRPEVAWIAVAIEQGAQPRRPPKGVAITPCPGDKPLSGYMEVTYVDNPYGHHDCQGTIRTVLRFPLVDNAASTDPWSRRLALGFHASELSYDVSTAGCVDTSGDDLICEAAGGRRTGSLIFGKNGWSGLGTSSGTSRGGKLEFDPLKPEMYFATLPDEIHTAFTRPLTCEPFDRGGLKATWAVGFAGGSIRPRGSGESDHAFLTFVDPTGCNDSVDCRQHPERYAVIPFSGRSVWTDPRPRAGIPRVEMTWDICCGCNATHPEPQAPLPDGATKR